MAFSGAILAGRYRLEEVVGYGGMGSVWRATHTGLGEQVAVKLVSANFVRSKEALRRFDTEAKSAAKLRSRHVPHVFDNGVLEDGTPFLVMELLHGESLAARLSRLGPIPLPETVSILEQCCRALSRAHSLGIVHRDIKPENVYLAQSVDDEGYIVKVLDFGIAKVASSLTDDGRTSTRTGTLLGTPLYMSPEQARGLRSIDFRTDLYSLGLVAYTMLTGGLPFSGETLGDLLLQICAEPLPQLRAAAPALPPTMETWFQKACARQPEDRYPTAQALVEALRVAAGISSARPSDSVTGRTPLQEHPSTAEPRRSDVAPSPVLGVPSTTAGTTVGTTSSSGSRRARWALVTASAILGLAVAPLIVLLARGHVPGSAGAPSTADDRRQARAAAPMTQVAALSPENAAAEGDGGLIHALTPLTTRSAPLALPEVLPPPAASLPSGDRLPGAAWHPTSHPVAGSMPPATTTKPPPASHAGKPTGAIDLGY
jgi:serine/threonine protein kinase